MRMCHCRQSHQTANHGPITANITRLLSVLLLVLVAGRMQPAVAEAAAPDEDQGTLSRDDQGHWVFANDLYEITFTRTGQWKSFKVRGAQMIDPSVSQAFLSRPVLRKVDRNVLVGRADSRSMRVEFEDEVFRVTVHDKRQPAAEAMTWQLHDRVSWAVFPRHGGTTHAVPIAHRQDKGQGARFIHRHGPAFETEHRTWLDHREGGRRFGTFRYPRGLTMVYRPMPRAHPTDLLFLDFQDMPENHFFDRDAVPLNVKLTNDSPNAIAVQAAITLESYAPNYESRVIATQQRQIQLPGHGSATFQAQFIPPAPGPYEFEVRAEHLPSAAANQRDHDRTAHPATLDASLGPAIAAGYQGAASQPNAQDAKDSATSPNASSQNALTAGDAHVSRRGTLIYQRQAWFDSLPDHEPADFDAFWQDTLQAMRSRPLRPRIGEPTERHGVPMVFQQVSFNGFGTTRVHGFLALPEGASPQNPVPAVLGLPGAGYGAAPLTLEHYERGWAYLSLTIHDLPFGGESGRHHPRSSWFDEPYQGIGRHDKEAFYYRTAYANCVRAVDFLKSLPQIDGDRIMVAGGSQGGSLTLAVAALEPTIAMAKVDVPGRVRWDLLTWKWKANCSFQAPQGITPQQMFHRALAYHDIAYFSRRVRVPVLIQVSMMDEINPGPLQWVAFREVPEATDKHLRVAPWAGHGQGVYDQPDPTEAMHRRYMTQSRH